MPWTLFGNTPLLLAVKKRDNDLIRLLLKHSPNVKAVNHAQESVLTLVEDSELAELLIDKGATLHSPNVLHKDTPLVLAIKTNNIPLIRLFLANNALNHEIVDNLFYSAKSIEAIELLLAANIQVNKNSFGRHIEKYDINFLYRLLNLIKQDVHSQNLDKLSASKIFLLKIFDKNNNLPGSMYFTSQQKAAFDAGCQIRKSRTIPRTSPGSQGAINNALNLLSAHHNQKSYGVTRIAEEMFAIIGNSPWLEIAKKFDEK